MKRKILLASAFAFVLLVAALFIFRNGILRSQLNKRIKVFNSHYQGKLIVGHASLKGLNMIHLSHITLSPATGDTLLSSDELNVHIRLLKLLFGKISLKNVELKNTVLSIYKKDSLNNYGFLLDHKKKNTLRDTTRNTDYYSRVSEILDAVFDKMPSNLNIINFKIDANIDSHFVSFHTLDFRITGRQLRSMLTVHEDTNSSCWYVESRINNTGRLIDFKIYSSDKRKLQLPFARFVYKAKIEFDTARFVFSEKKFPGRILALSGLGYLSGLVLNHKKIASDDVIFNEARISYKVNVGKDFFEFDSSSTIKFNKLEFSPYIKVRMYPTKQITLKINKKRFPAQDLFESLPTGLFTNFEGIETSGDIAYHLDFFVDFGKPDSLKFESDIKQFKFHIVHFGKTNFAKINDSFFYTAYDNGVPVRSFYVGPRNPNYRKLDDISLFLEDAVITSEDGTFFYDRGFRMDAVRRAIAVNIKKRKFVQGASTISMQLMKNVFLNRKKTIARKFEEIMITWLIDYNGLCSKERIYEVYLNIAEWGPGVYGANEAAHFYFNKDAAQLSLAESIFLANILPHPKSFQWLFDDRHHLKSFLNGYYNLLSTLMLKRGVISEDDKDDLEPDVDLTGPAKNMLSRIDTTEVDTNTKEDWY